MIPSADASTATDASTSKDANSKPTSSEKGSKPTEIETTAANPKHATPNVDSDSESEAEIIRPRKPHRKLIPSADASAVADANSAEDALDKPDAQAMPAPGQGVVIAALRKFMIVETPLEQDFENEH